MLTFAVIAVICFVLERFLESTVKQWRLEQAWLRRYKFIPNGFSLIVDEKFDRCLLIPWKKLTRREWFGVPENMRAMVKDR